MIANRTIALLDSFVSGRTDINQFRRQIDDRLFELRQKPTMSQEKKFLSKIQLYLHEVDEGSRELIEVYMVSQAALDLAKPLTAPIENKIDTLDLLLEGVLPGTASGPEDVTCAQLSGFPS